MGSMSVPTDALWGAQTQRAVENFGTDGGISGRTMHTHFVHTLGLVKKACAVANRRMGKFKGRDADVKAIIAASQEVYEGKHDKHFVVEIYQTGSGTSTNMNANEVLSNLAILKRGGKLGSRSPVHPNDDINMGQSSNDVIPTTLKVAAATRIKDKLIPALKVLAAELTKKAKEWEDIVKSGRTHLMDATPVTLGQVFGGYAAQITKGVQRAERAIDAMHELALGGTAVGTGINTPANFPGVVIEELAAWTGIPFVEAPNHFEAQAAQDGVVEAHGNLKAIAASLFKIASDVRLLGSGPRAAIGELILPAVAPGSSIMPGKTNPVMAEALTMAAARVMGNDVTINMAGASGQFELNVFLPVMSEAILESIDVLAGASRKFAVNCIAGTQADRGKISKLIEGNLVVATALNELIGYDQASKLVKTCYNEGVGDLGIRELATKWIKAGTLTKKDGSALTVAELDAGLALKKMTMPDPPLDADPRQDL